MVNGFGTFMRILDHLFTFDSLVFRETFRRSLVKKMPRMRDGESGTPAIDHSTRCGAALASHAVGRARVAWVAGET